MTDKPAGRVRSQTAAAGAITRRDDPEVLLEWNANDEGPPCIDFTCPCGHWQHLCNGPDWITEGLGQVPGVECVKCDKAWSLYRVRIITMIRGSE